LTEIIIIIAAEAALVDGALLVQMVALAEVVAVEAIPVLEELAEGLQEILVQMVHLVKTEMILEEMLGPILAAVVAEQHFMVLKHRDLFQVMVALVL
jgi:hypothetical protein